MFQIFSNVPTFRMHGLRQYFVLVLVGTFLKQLQFFLEEIIGLSATNFSS